MPSAAVRLSLAASVSLLVLPTAAWASGAAAGDRPVPVASALAVGATLALILGVAAVLAVRAMALRRLKRLALEKTRHIASGNLRRVSIRRVLQLATIGTRLAALALILGGLATWATALLDLLPATHQLAVDVEQTAYAGLGRLATAALTAVPDLIIIALIFFLTRVVHEMLNHYFRSIIDGEVESAAFDKVTAETTRRLADIGLWVAALIIAFPYIPGSDSAAFRGVTVLAGLMVSLGSSSLVGQVASGLTLIYGRALRPGEFVEAGGTEGVVERIGLFACTLRTARDEIVVLPHGTVAAALKNYSREGERVRYAATVTIGYDTPWRQVRDLLLTAARATPGIRAEPPPTVRQSELGDFSVGYELLFTPEVPADRNPLLGRVHEAIQDEFHRAGVQIMSPHYNNDPVGAKVPPGRPPG
jgi:small-conductance mechanosensitive channel